MRNVFETSNKNVNKLCSSFEEKNQENQENEMRHKN